MSTVFFGGFQNGDISMKNELDSALAKTGKELHAVCCVQLV